MFVADAQVLEAAEQQLAQSGAKRKAEGLLTLFKRDDAKKAASSFRFGFAA